MPATHVLSLGLAVACLCGINLYLTLFLLGLSLRAGWLAVELFPGIHLLANPVVLTVVGLLYLLETVTDKVPMIDSFWDLLHSVIRPAGAVILALAVMGDAEPAYQVLAGIIAGVAGLSTHLAKTTLRLRINASPEVHTNILTSLAEDALVAGLFALTVRHPFSGLIACGALVGLILLLVPRLTASARASLFFMWRKLRLPGGAHATGAVEIPARVTAEQDMLLAAETGLERHTVLWAVKCVTSRARGVAKLGRNQFGTLVAVREMPAGLVFIRRSLFSQSAVRVPLQGCEIRHESGFVSEDLVIYSRQEKVHAVFRFTRAETGVVERLAEDLTLRLGLRPQSAMTPGAPTLLPVVAIDPAPPPAPDIIPEPPVILSRAPVAAPPSAEVAPFPVRSADAAESAVAQADSLPDSVPQPSAPAPAPATEEHASPVPATTAVPLRGD